MKAVTVSLQIAAQLAKVVDLPIEFDSRRSVRGLHRLPPKRRGVDDRQAAMCEPDERRRGIPFAGIIRTPMTQCLCERSQKSGIEMPLEAGNAAHDDLTTAVWKR